MKKIFFAAAVIAAFVLLALPAAAANASAPTAQEAAGNYANAGESASAVEFKAAGNDYAMVKINGAESVLLKRDANGVFAAVANESDLLPVVREYLQQQFEAIGFASRAAAIKTNYEAYSVEGGRCVEASKKLIRMSRTTPPYLYITTNAGRDYPREYAALNRLKATAQTFEKSFNATGNAVETIDEKVASKNADETIAAFNEIHDQTAAFKAAYVNVSQSHTDIVATFPNAFLLQVDLKDHCALDPNQTTAVDAVITQSSLGAIKTASELSKQIALTTAARAPDARKRALDSDQRRRIDSFSEQITNLTKEYAEAASAAGAQPMTLTVLWTQLGELNTLHTQASTAHENASAALAASFEKKARELEDKIAFFKATESDYAKSLVAVSNATREVDKIVKKYGSNDERVASLQKDLRNLQTASKSYNDLLRDAMATSASFQSVTANATALSTRAATLAPKENQLDLVLVGGVVILVGAVVGAFYYLKKKKGEGVMVIPPAQYPQSPQSPPRNPKAPY